MIRVRELREARGLQQKELAIDLCVSQPTISDWESGRKVPSAKSTQKLADYFNVTIDYLLGRNDEKKEPPAQGGEPIGPNKQALLDIVDTMSNDEMGALLELIKATKKLRNTEQ